ncbi:hypothetical protein Z517_00999 [Fonsecaea pedrosoi CBS 271.37]|uniref:Uncharacterized protein n=1 Tax=Fonsecaea pedrosoi CBS 271.37 TaxID=1442368 RepID=A0A0D2FFY0_9EURO|nr:uncharacterized protein Z517_00999 [Fonsecaea pedrosoi CBS 271.37]KIW85607.1 hypothetical protein Z517_00999 [Fonsecaea pedrosoi CBS 271.37]
MSAKFVLALSVSFLVLSSPVFAKVSAPAANICTWTDAMPVLYHEYGTDVCPPRFRLKPGSGDCQDDPGSFNVVDCASFCEMRTEFRYGQEVPYHVMPMCTGGTSCTLTENRHVGSNWKFKLNGNYKTGPFTAGVAGGYNEKAGQSESFKYSKDLKHNECGYFTFIPIMRDTCGTYTEGQLDKYNNPAAECKSTRTVGNACCSQAVTVTDRFYWFTRVVRGVAVFVYLNCDTLEPLEDKYQESPFNKPGVRLPRGLGLTNAYKDIWFASQFKTLASQSDSAVCNDRKDVNATDCMEVLADVTDRGADVVPLSNTAKGNGITIGAFNSCIMHLSFNEEWTPGRCVVSYLEIAAAAQTVFDTCTNNNTGMIGGSHVVRRIGECGATVSFLSKSTPL